MIVTVINVEMQQIQQTMWPNAECLITQQIWHAKSEGQQSFFLWWCGECCKTHYAQEECCNVLYLHKNVRYSSDFTFASLYMKCI